MLLLKCFAQKSPLLSFIFYLIFFSDLARDIYQNATIEKIALIRFILDREKKTAQYDEQLNQRIPVCFYPCTAILIGADVLPCLGDTTISPRYEDFE